jgi:hypothetical protein
MELGIGKLKGIKLRGHELGSGKNSSAKHTLYVILLGKKKKIFFFEIFQNCFVITFYKIFLINQV